MFKIHQFPGVLASLIGWLVGMIFSVWIFCYIVITC